MRLHPRRGLHVRFPHTCIIGKSSEGSATSGYEVPRTWDDTYATAVPCFWQQMSTKQQISRTIAGVTLSTIHLFLAYRTDLAVANAPSVYRILTVADADGVTMEAGPFSIASVLDPTGLHHHLELELKKAPRSREV